MLQSLEVHHFALIDNLRVEFTSGFNVFTGETGAGKSILIDAFGLVLGGRASVEYLRPGADAYWIQAVFDIEGEPAVQEALKELDFTNGDDTLFLRRKVTASGKSQAFVNERQVPVHVLSRLGTLLADIHGQHENQSLLLPEAPLRVVDQYDKSIPPLLASYKQSYQKYRVASQELHTWLTKNAHQEEDLKQLEEAIQEIDNAQVKPGEDEQLRKTVKKLLHQENILQAVGEAHHYLEGGENDGVLDGLNRAVRSLEQVLDYAPELMEYRDALDSSWQTLEDVRQSLGDLLQSDSGDQETLARAQERLDTLYYLKQKYGGTLENVLATQEKMKKEHQDLLSLESTIEKSRKKETLCRKEMEEQANKLSQAREKAAQALCKALLPHIRDLAMPQGKVEIRLNRLSQCSSNGQDEGVFLFSANAGMDMKPLGKIASGGELSRFALALKTATLQNCGVSTMIFDEIDTGIGGVTAQKMGEKMALIAEQHQVLCITHLAQIASFADHHLFIQKQTENETTLTSVEPLEEEGRVREIMRMTGGTNTSASVEKSAREMLMMAKAFKQKEYHQHENLT